jgi:dipeptidyl aminopeptidase/acylaminoacyl peptidase
VSSLVDQLLYVPYVEKLVVSSVAAIIEKLGDFELYWIDLRNPSTLIKLTENEAYEMELQLSVDGRHVLFRTFSITSNKIKVNNTQYRLYSLNLFTRQTTRLVENFHGSISGFTSKYDSGVYILGQLGTSVQIYSQRSPTDNLIYYNGWNGTYESIVSSRYDGSIAFVHSSLEKPMEVYLISNINQLKSAQPITNENNLFIQRHLPQTKVYNWINKDDHRRIEGILHYPPGKFQHKNLPLLVLIHGGPYLANLNRFELVWHNWATLAASEGWLVLEPNYRGSTGYGDQFLSEIRYKPLSRPGKDILFGIDQLIKDRTVNPYRLAIGGYSYGGLLTNWLITQTRRFNAALSGAGVTDYTSVWGTMDLPVMISHLFGGFPWEVPHTYQNESPIYQLNRVRTPTHIITGESDVRVPGSQSYILERGLHYLGIPVKLVTFPKEGHSLNNNPWYGKIKVREELKWLQKYGNQSLNHNEYSNNSRKLKPTSVLQLYIFLFVIIRNM